MELHNSLVPPTQVGPRSPGLPMDVWKHIIEVFAKSFRREAVCTEVIPLISVCRGFRATAERMLYRHLELTIEDSVKGRPSQLLATLADRPELGTYVRTLVLVAMRTDNLLTSIYCCIMSHCNFVESLTLEDMTVYKFGLLKKIITRMNPTRLTISGGWLTRTRPVLAHIRDIFRLIDDCTNIRFLFLGPLICDGCTVCVPYRTKALPLEVLDCDHWSAQTLNFVRGMRLPNLKEIFASHVNDPRARESLVLCLQAWRSTLTVLTLTMHNNDCFCKRKISYPEFSAVVADLPQLRVLVTASAYINPQALIRSSSIEEVLYWFAGLRELEYFLSALREPMDNFRRAMPSLKSFVLIDVRKEWGVIATALSLRGVLEARGVIVKLVTIYGDLDWSREEEMESFADTFELLL